MALIVKKFGGTSLANIDMIRKVASRVANTYVNGDDLVIVLSAMAKATDNLISLAYKASSCPDKRELDVLLATGEQTTVSVLAMILKQMGYKAKSVLAHQIGITTNSSYGNASILNIDVCKIKQILQNKIIAVVAGFQGCDKNGDITTLGRGGSDTSAVALAAALGADECEIYTDVDGIYTADPDICPEARKLKNISYDAMLSMASLGTKVLHKDSINFAKDYGVVLHVRSSFLFKQGTIVDCKNDILNKPSIIGITYDLSYAKIIFEGIPNNCDIDSEILIPIVELGISIDMVEKRILLNGSLNFIFTVPKEQFEKALYIGKLAAGTMNISKIIGSKYIAKVSVVGMEMNQHFNLTNFAFKALNKGNINTIMINNSKSTASCIIKRKHVKPAVQILHSFFQLG